MSATAAREYLDRFHARTHSLSAPLIDALAGPSRRCVVPELLELFTTALGGGGTSRAEAVRIARRGMLNVLRHCGIVAGTVEVHSTRWLDMPFGECFSFVEEDGMLEPLVDLGEPLERGQIMARIHHVAKTGAAPAEIRAGFSGLLAARHFPGLVKTGACAAVVAVQTSAPR